MSLGREEKHTVSNIKNVLFTTDLCTNGTFATVLVTWRPDIFFNGRGGKEGLDMVHSGQSLLLIVSQEDGDTSGGLSV